MSLAPHSPTHSHPVHPVFSTTVASRLGPFAPSHSHGCSLIMSHLFLFRRPIASPAAAHADSCKMQSQRPRQKEEQRSFADDGSINQRQRNADTQAQSQRVGRWAEASSDVHLPPLPLTHASTQARPSDRCADSTCCAAAHGLSVARTDGVTVDCSDHPPQPLTAARSPFRPLALPFCLCQLAQPRIFHLLISHPPWPLRCSRLPRSLIGWP